MNTKKYNWAILGCGNIAEEFAKALALSPRARLAAVASRSLDTARLFAARHGVAKAFASYEQLAADSGIDIVYIATPHSHHMEHSVLCMEHGKAVLCEKAFAINSKQVKRMIDTATAQKVFLMEALWTRFQPSFQKALVIVRSGELGRLRMVRADFGFFGNQDPAMRLYDINLGGGSLLDVGIYPVFMALSLLGVPDQVQALAILAPGGADELISVSFAYKNGTMASLSSSIAAWSPIQAELWFEKGYLRLNRHFNVPTSLTLCLQDGPEENIVFPQAGNGYTAEAEHVMDCLDQGLTESPLLPLSLSLDLIATLDRIRASAGIIYPADAT